MRPELLRTVYLLGSTETGHLGHVSLAAGGNLLGSDDPRRARYGFRDDRLFLLDAATDTYSAQLRYVPEANSFLPDNAGAICAKC
jgi:hypothetical protein